MKAKQQQRTGFFMSPFFFAIRIKFVISLRTAPERRRADAIRPYGIFAHIVP